jgi:uncharacterized repeat protein (TIGR02543 family)
MFRNFLRLFAAVLIISLFAACSDSDDSYGYGKYTVSYYDRENHIYTSFLYAVRAGEGEVIQLPDLDNSEYRLLKRHENDTFYGWKDAKGELHPVPLEPYTVTSDMEFDAVWDVQRFKVTFYNEDGVTVYDDSFRVQRDGSILLPKLADTPTHFFQGWKRGDPGSTVVESGTVEIDDNTSFYQAWYDISGDFLVGFYDATTILDPADVPFLTVTPNNYSVAPGKRVAVPSSSSNLTLPYPDNFSVSHAGYIFDGWYLLNTGVRYPAGYTYIVSGSVSFYARWKAKDPLNPPATVKANLYDDGILLASVDDYPVNAQNLVSNIDRKGYTFDGWIPADDPGNKYYSDGFAIISIGEDTDLTAHFTMNDPITIKTPAELNDVRTAPDKNYRLGNNIPLSTDFGKESANETWTPIDNFTGNFDGNGYEVSGLYIDYSKLPADNQSYVGLFAFTDNGSRIENLTVDVAEIIGKNYAGGVTGYVKGTVDYTSKIVDSKVISTDPNAKIHIENTDETASAGGVAGALGDYATVINAANSVEVYVKGSTAYAGGITGLVAGSSGAQSTNTSQITRSTNTAKITAEVTGHTTEGYAGGLAGRYRANQPLSFSHNTGEINSITSAPASASQIYSGGIYGRGNTTEDSYNTGVITANNTSVNPRYTYAGGLSGAGAWIARGYNTASISAIGGAAHAGGLSGDGEDSINNSYNTGYVSADATYDAAIVGGVIGFQLEGIINRTYNTGDVRASYPNHSAFAGGIIGDKFNVVVVGNAAINAAVTAIGSSRHANRILGGIRTGGGYNLGVNFALETMSSQGGFTNSGTNYNGADKTAEELQTKTVYSTPIADGGLGFEFCEEVSITSRPCGKDYPWKTAGNASGYKYPILYWQNSDNPF